MRSDRVPIERSQTPRIGQLDGLRAVAILLVFSFHAFKANLMWMGVDIFFVLSGFLITGILLKEKDKPFGEYIGGFYARRARRILPAYLVILAIAAAIFGIGWLRWWYLYIGGMNFITPLGLPYLQVLPLWSLAVEEQFYLMWPIAVYVLSRRQLTVLAWTLIVLAPTLRFVCTPYFSSGYAVYMLLPFRMDTLAAGALAAIYWRGFHTRVSSDVRLRKAAVRTLGILFGFAVAVALVLNGQGILPTKGNVVGNTALIEATLAISVSMFVLVLLGVGQRFLGAAAMRWTGRISYSIYLFHLTALHLANNNGLVGLALSLAYASAMWYLVESPILSYNRKSAEVAEIVSEVKGDV